MKNKDYKWTFKEVLVCFEYIENQLSLVKSVIQGVLWWDKLIHELFNELLIKLKLNENLERNKTFKILKVTLTNITK
jgi:hypothetical protein